MVKKRKCGNFNITNDYSMKLTVNYPYYFHIKQAKFHKNILTGTLLKVYGCIFYTLSSLI